MKETEQADRPDQAALTLELTGDGVAWLVFDRPGSKQNILSSGVMERLDTLIAELETKSASGEVRAVVVRSGKEGTFIAGADIDEIASVTDPAEARNGASKGQQVFRRLEKLPVPVVAAVDGVCLGGGTELVLACDYRIAADEPRTRIGLPEIRLGIIPGFGGTVRLPRLIGLMAASDLILTGKTVTARKAHRLGLIDERVPAPILTERAGEAALELVGGEVEAGGDGSLWKRILEGTPPGRALILRQAKKQVMKQTRGHYPAPLRAIEVMRRTASMDLDRALAVEAAAVGDLAVSDVAKSLIHVFRLMESAKKVAASAEPVTANRAGVMGAGTMGGGIAQLLAYQGLDVRLKDIAEPALADGLRHARRLFDEAVKRRKMDRREAERAMDRIAPSLDYSGFGTVDIVIEAVVERMDVKKKVLAETESQVPERAVLTSNTSTLSITEMQGALERPERFCGMHFFNPVHRMPLVEVIRGGSTSDAAVSTVFALSRRLGKTPVLVNDGPGFLVNRILSPYLNEAGWLLADGATIMEVDQAMLEFGMPMGPFRLLDEVGLDVARHAGSVMEEAFGERMQAAPPLIKLESTDRLGKKGGLGFYVYEDGRAQEPDADVYEQLGASIPADRREIPAREIQDRCVLIMVNEAALALADGITDDPGTVDLAMIMGTGFPPFRGGLLRYADAVGLDAIVRRLEAFQETSGLRFQPADSLRERAESGRGFYD